MKQTAFFFLSFLFLLTNLYSQVEVSPRLLTTLSEAEPDEFIRTIVYLRDQVDLETLDARLYAENASLERRAYEVITTLQDKAEKTQGNLISYIESKMESRDVFSYEKFWIANMLMVEAKPSVINELMSRMDLAIMDLDALLELVRPEEESEGEVEGTETVEPGIRIINAHLLWQMGITGQGRLVLGIDTGVYPNHPALAHKWRGNHVPSSQAWFDPQGNTTVPSDCDSHGSHTVGTMVGRSLTTPDTIGVAIDAEWIAAKTICSSPHTTRSIAALEWSMDPDNDPTTINDMPDAICNSWHDPATAPNCFSIYRQVLSAVEAAGIAVVFAAGNSGPNGSTILYPQNINVDETNTFTVGAIDGAAFNAGSTNPIASFSSRGPSACGGTGSILIKPEVSAPGVSVRSAGTTTGYTSKSGTSMAAPHVAGAVALLKQFAPTLTGKQILEALYYTARDYGSPGEDNVYGMGIIDVYAAMLSLGTPDTVPPAQITDLTVTSQTSNSVSLQWTVPVDSSMNGVTAYNIRMSTSPITDTASFNNATQVPFPGLPDTIGATQQFTVKELQFGTTYYFAIKASDLWGNWSQMSNVANAATYAAPQISVNPTSVHHVMENAQTVVDTVFVSNITVHNSTLSFNLQLDNHTFPDESSYRARLITLPGSGAGEDEEEAGIDKNDPKVAYGLSFEGSGGPDNFGYTWIDSDEPNGPQYVWNDISSTGTLVTNWIATGTFDPKDEGYAGPFPLGFNFKFYGVPQTQIYVSSNGFLHFAPLTANSFTNANIPNTAAPNDYIAPFWDDLDGRTQGTVHYKQDGNKFIVQFTNWQRFSGTGSLTFQAVLYSNGRIEYYYNNMNSTTLNSATVGIENATGTDGLLVVYNANYVKNNLAVKIAAEPDWIAHNNFSGLLHNGNTFAVELTINSEDYPEGEYKMDLIITSNDPVNPTLTVPITMFIGEEIPVELTSFTAESERDEVLLNWTTATELNNSGFKVERKLRDGQWNEVSFVEGRGTTTERSIYSYRDKGVSIGSYVYRLKQIDFDGTYSYSQEVEVDVAAPQQYALYQNYPNPFNPATVIEYSVPEAASVTINIYNVVGELISTIATKEVESGYHRVEFDAGKLPSGTYLYQLIANGQSKSFTDVKKMLLVK